jgi:hypothetical protein
MKLANGFNAIEDKAKTEFKYAIEGIKLNTKIA